MKPMIFDLTSDCREGLVAMTSAVVGKVYDSTQCEPRDPNGPPVALKVKISLETWKDADGKRHWKLSVE